MPTFFATGKARHFICTLDIICVESDVVIIVKPTPRVIGLTDKSRKLRI